MPSTDVMQLDSGLKGRILAELRHQVGQGEVQVISQFRETAKVMAHHDAASGLAPRQFTQRLLKQFIHALSVLSLGVTNGELWGALMPEIGNSGASAAGVCSAGQ